ncbi:hypothetical protein FOL47_006583 [Perkinsus chesapeaki]|uniref:Uncharacterized protein n=1 Tax=Perkinsus chesapeaki TaxID=330153 RepID=A0A7J6MX55_PERCH|nr:hypothetical protein FOL47_006583 [Perkinsus chesapeaki]
MSGKQDSSFFTSEAVDLGSIATARVQEAAFYSGQMYAHAAKELLSRPYSDERSVDARKYKVLDYRLGTNFNRAHSVEDGLLQREEPKKPEPLPEPAASAACLAAKVRNADIEVADLRRRECWLTPGHIMESSGAMGPAKLDFVTGDQWASKAAAFGEGHGASFQRCFSVPRKPQASSASQCYEDRAAYLYGDGLKNWEIGRVEGASYLLRPASYDPPVIPEAMQHSLRRRDIGDPPDADQQPLEDVLEMLCSPRARRTPRKSGGKNDDTIGRTRLGFNRLLEALSEEPEEMVMCGVRDYSSPQSGTTVKPEPGPGTLVDTTSKAPPRLSFWLCEFLADNAGLSQLIGCKDNLMLPTKQQIRHSRKLRRSILYHKACDDLGISSPFGDGEPISEKRLHVHAIDGESVCMSAPDETGVIPTEGDFPNEEKVDEEPSLMERHVFESVLSCVIERFAEHSEKERQAVRDRFTKLFTELTHRTTMIDLLNVKDSSELRRMLFYPLAKEDMPRYLKGLCKATTILAMNDAGTAETDKIRLYLVTLLYLKHIRVPSIAQAVAESYEGMFSLVEHFEDPNPYVAAQAMDVFFKVVATSIDGAEGETIWNEEKCPGVHHAVLKKCFLSPTFWSRVAHLTSGKDSYPFERRYIARLLGLCLHYLSTVWVDENRLPEGAEELTIGKKLNALLIELQESHPDIYEAFFERVCESLPVGTDNRMPREVLQDQLFEEDDVDWCKGSVIETMPESKRNSDRAAEMRALGNHMTRNKKYEHALSCYAYSLQWHSEEPLTHCNMAMCHLKLGNWKEAVSAAESAIVRDAGMMKAWYRKAEGLSAMLKLVSNEEERDMIRASLREALDKARDLGCDAGLLQRLHCISATESDPILLDSKVTVSRKRQLDSGDTLKMWRTREDFEAFVSSSIDVFKGWFITFMLMEHTRSCFHVGMDKVNWPIMHIVSKAACSLDMTCFSTAYGFMCYRSYFVNTKNRPLSTTLTRVFRSVSLVVLALIIMNITFSISTLNHMPNFKETAEIITLSTVYWDFLAAFPLELLMGFITTKPIIEFSMRYRHKRAIARLVLFLFLLGWPLVLSSFNLHHCQNVGERYLSLLVGCRPLEFRATRFPAVPYMFYFNFGCIVSQLLLEYTESLPRGSDAIRRSYLPRSQNLSDLSEVSTPSNLDSDGGLPPPVTSGTYRKDNFVPYLVAFGLLMLVELVYLTPLAMNPQVTWEYLDWNGYVRFPMNYKVILAWGVLSHSVLIFSMIFVAFAKNTTVICHIIDFLEHCGANVLLYLLVNSLIIHGIFHNHWVASGTEEDQEAPETSPYSNFAWEMIVLIFGAGQRSSASCYVEQYIVL